MQKLSFRFYDNQKTGHLVARITKDLEEVGEVAHHEPEDAFIAVMTFLGSFALMMTLNVKLALITGLVVPPMTWISTRYGAAMTRTWRTLFGREHGLVRHGFAAWRRYFCADFHPTQSDGAPSLAWLQAHAELAPPVRA